MPTPRFIVITGVTRGLGRAMADGFIQLGHVVAGCGRTPAAVDDLRRQHPAPHDWQTVDVADHDQVDRWSTRLLDSHDPPDLLINNAAVITANAPLWQVPADAFDTVVDVNVKGVANVIRAFVPAMIAAGRGVIVNLSSGWGRSTAPDVAPYCATKWAVEGLTAALAQELPPNLAAVAFNPGVIDTDMLRLTFGPEAAQYRPPDQWARTAVPYLLNLGPKDNGQQATAP